MNIALTAAPNTGNVETMDLTKVQYMPVQMIPLVDWEKGERRNEFPYSTSVIRYPVHEGWIVGTIIGHGDAPAFCQSFVPDPDHMWTPTFGADTKTNNEADPS